jgi:hypothetical protein
VLCPVKAEVFNAFSLELVRCPSFFLVHCIFPLRQTHPDQGLVCPAWTGLFLTQHV